MPTDLTKRLLDEPCPPEVRMEAVNELERLHNLLLNGHEHCPNCEHPVQPKEILVDWQI